MPKRAFGCLSGRSLMISQRSSRGNGKSGKIFDGAMEGLVKGGSSKS